MNILLRKLFMILLVFPVVFVWLGIRIWKKHRLPQKGPAIIVANHNSHLDVFILLSLFSLSKTHQVQPVAAADYFLKNKWLAWFSLRVVGIIPVIRQGDPTKQDPLAACKSALEAGKIIILFPEGTRGEPESLSEIKSGLWYLCQSLPDVPVIPIGMSGLGRAMGKGQWIPIPFFIDVYIGKPLFFMDDKEVFKCQLKEKLVELLQTLKSKNS